MPSTLPWGFGPIGPLYSSSKDFTMSVYSATGKGVLRDLLVLACCRSRSFYTETTNPVYEMGPADSIFTCVQTQISRLARLIVVMSLWLFPSGNNISFSF